jgi:hypothetical protein
MFRTIRWSLFIGLEAATAGILFRAAAFNHLPADVAKAAWVLGGCVVAMTATCVVAAFKKA